MVAGEGKRWQCRFRVGWDTPRHCVGAWFPYHYEFRPSLIIFSHACKELSTFGCCLITLVVMVFLLRDIDGGVVSDSLLGSSSP